MCRELTKKFEEVLRGTLAELAETCSQRSLKGEIVVLIDRAGSADINESDIDLALKEALGQMSVRDAADKVAHDLGLKRRQVYQMALKLGDET